MPLQTDQILNNRYQVIRLLAKGGFGAVYYAWDGNLNRACAIKENLNVTPEAQRQFAREATILASLSHPNLPRVTDHFTIQGQGQYLVMDFVEGEDLATRVERQGPVSVQQALIWIYQVLDALAYLHSRQPPVIHRDIKPSNIRITPEGRAVLVDFGLVKASDPGLKTTLGARAVTPGYAPPEQYGQGHTDMRTDIYALGATLYTLLTGQEPMESVRRMVGGQMLAAHQLNPQISAHVGMAIERAMAIDPAQRFQSVGEFKSALQGVTPAVAPYAATVVAASPPPVAAVPSATVVAGQPSPGFEVPRARPMVEQAMPAVPVPSARQRPAFFWIGFAAILALCFGVSVAAIGWYFANQEIGEKDTPTSESATTPGEALVFGPVDGSLVHDLSVPAMKANAAPVDLRDFILEVRFFNPYSAAEGSWDYGVVFRHQGENQHYRLVIKSDGSWVLLNNVGLADGITLVEGFIPELNLNQGGSNHLRLVCQQDRGTFFVNGRLVADLDLSDRLNSGRIFVVTGVFLGDEINGKSTDYQDFQIWSLP